MREREVVVDWWESKVMVGLLSFSVILKQRYCSESFVKWKFGLVVKSCELRLERSGLRFET